LVRKRGGEKRKGSSVREDVDNFFAESGKTYLEKTMSIWRDWGVKKRKGVDFVWEGP